MLVTWKLQLDQKWHPACLATVLIIKCVSAQHLSQQPPPHFQRDNLWSGFQLVKLQMVQSLCSRKPASPALAATGSGQSSLTGKAFWRSAPGSDGSKPEPTDSLCHSAAYLCFGQWWNYYLIQILILIFKTHEPPKLKRHSKKLSSSKI